MHVITRRRLQEFWDRHPRARVPLQTWHKIVRAGRWAGPEDIKSQFGTNVDFVGDNRVIFDIGGNKYRIVVHVAYRFGKVLVKFVGTHNEYNKINAETIT